MVAAIIASVFLCELREVYAHDRVDEDQKILVRDSSGKIALQNDPRIVHKGTLFREDIALYLLLEAQKPHQMKHLRYSMWRK